jgi:predicted Zn-dependent protease with MMP-like domain
VKEDLHVVVPVCRGLSKPGRRRDRRTAGQTCRVEMTRREFEDLVADALDTVPAELADLMDNVVVLVEDEPEHDGPDLLGVYDGVALTERTSNYGGVLPDRITIYRGPILRICDTRDDVVHEVVTTVVHEIGHHFGIPERRLHELGWG